MSVRPKTLPPIQDMPPAGGFRKIDTIRHFPGRGPKGWQLWLGTSVAIVYGMAMIGKTNREKAQQRLEERKMRFAIAPILQAESDREYAIREKVILAKEAEIMKNVPGWKVGESQYYTKKENVPRKINPLDKRLT